MAGWWARGRRYRRRRAPTGSGAAGWAAGRSRPAPVANGIRARSRRGAIGETWWSQRWVSVLASFGLGSRLQRGRAYARRGHVLGMDVQPGAVKARVQGTRATPYRVEIRVATLTDRQWEQAVQAMAGQASFAASLLAGEMPPNIEQAFQAAKVSLFPERLSELRTSCSCPDWANPCKHVAAVYYLLAEAFDRNPFVIFTLRGRTKEQIIERLRALRAGAAARPSPSRAPASAKQARSSAATRPGEGREASREVRSALAPDPLLQGLRRALANLPARPVEDDLDLFWLFAILRG